MAEIEFENITHISYEIKNEVELRILISVRRPVNVRKRLRNQTNSVRSPFNMHTQNMFLNYWNVNQTFYLEGTHTGTKFKEILQFIKQ